MGPTGVFNLKPKPTLSVMVAGFMSRTRANTLPVSENRVPPIGPHSGNLTSLLITSKPFPPSGLATRIGFPFESNTDFLGHRACARVAEARLLQNRIRGDHERRRRKTARKSAVFACLRMVMRVPVARRTNTPCRASGELHRSDHVR